MKKNSLLQQNIEYFNKEILPYYIILHTSNGAIVIETKEENLKHLLGVSHSFISSSKISAKRFYNNLMQGHYTLFDLIDEERYKTLKLTYEEELIFRKNKYFCSTFTTLFDTPNLYLYRKKNNSEFNTDHLHFQLVDNCGLYIGIRGNSNNNYYCFNSILVENTNPKKYLTGTRVRVTKIERIRKIDFSEGLYTIYPSKHNRESQHCYEKKREI